MTAEERKKAERNKTERSKEEISRKEIFRYLGYGSHEPDERTARLVEECVNELEQIADIRILKREFPLMIGANGIIEGGCFLTDSRNLLKNLGGCGQVLVMAVTLGPEVDRRLSRYGKLDMAKAVVMQAAAAAMIEACCNRSFLVWREEYQKKGLYLRPRFSPGYGDFPLSCQQGILDGLEAGKRIGITLTDGGLMMPSKSVTAVIGISRIPGTCEAEGCEACEKKDCIYRRES